MEEANFSLDFDVVLDHLDQALPEIPGKPVVQQINPPPYKLPFRVTFGKLMPVEGEDGKKKKGAAKKAPARKKDEKPPKPVQWAGPPEPEPLSTHYLMKQAERQMQESIFPMSLKGSAQNPGIMPALIKEVFFPPEAP